MKKLLFLLLLATLGNILLAQNPAQFNPTVYTKPLPKVITIPNQPSDVKMTTHVVNIKVPADSAKKWGANMETRYIKRLFNVIKDVDCLILNYSGFYYNDGSSAYSIERGFSFEINIQNKIRNIGLSLFDRSSFYNSEKLKQIITLSEDFALRPQIVTHEFFHQWNSFLESANYWLIDPSHHTGLVEDKNTVFYSGPYSEFKHVSDSIYSIKSRMCTGFPGKLEGYLAGLWDMPDTLKTLKNYWFYQYSQQPPNEDGSWNQQVKADSLVVLNKTRLFSLYGGERIPNYINSKKDFDCAVVIFTVDDFLSDDKLKGFHYMSLLNELEGTAEEYNNLYDQVCQAGTGYMNPDYGYRQTNPYHSSFKKLHLHTRLFKDDGTVYAVPNSDGGGIIGSAAVCRGESHVVYRIPEINYATSYIWTLPPGSTGSSTTNAIEVNYGATASPGTITVKGTNNVGDGNLIVLPIQIVDSKILPDTPGSIIGQNVVCPSQNSVIYTVPEAANSTSYIWTLPTGASGSSTTNSIAVAFSSNASSGDITVKGINCNGEGEPRKLSVKVNNVAAKFDIVGPSSICKGDTVFYSLVPGNGVVSYYANHGGMGKLVSKTKVMVYVDKDMPLSSFGIQVTYYSECGEENTAFKSVTVNNLQSTAPVITSNGNVLHSNASSGNQWYNQNGIINGATSQNYTAVANGDYHVVQTIGGCTSEASNVIHIVATGVEKLEANRAIKVYPNPVSNELVIEMEGNQTEQNFEVVNSNGQTVFKGCIFEKTIVQTSSFSSGVYLVRFDDGETIEVKKIVKE
jgi:hypothetical protein